MPLRNRWYLGIGALVVIIAVAWVVVLLTRSEEEPQLSELDQQIAAMEQAQAAGDAANLTAISEAAVAIQPELLSVMTALHGPMPTNEAAAVELTPAQVDEVYASLATARAELDGLSSGDTAYNVARNGFLLSVDLLADTTKALAEDQSAAADPQSVAFGLRQRAADAFQLAATQLDWIMVEGDRGHLHVALPLLPTGDEKPDTDPNHGAPAPR